MEPSRGVPRHTDMRHHRHHVLLLIALLLTGALMAGCGQQGAPAQGGSSGGASQQPTQQPSASAGPEAQESLATPPPSRRGKTTTVRGALSRAATNPECIQVRTQAGQFFGVGGLSQQVRDQVPSPRPTASPKGVLRTPAEGLQVRLTGHLSREHASVCGGSRTFVVTDVEVLDDGQ